MLPRFDYHSMKIADQTYLPKVRTEDRLSGPRLLRIAPGTYLLYALIVIALVSLPVVIFLVLWGPDADALEWQAVDAYDRQGKGFLPEAYLELALGWTRLMQGSKSADFGRRLFSFADYYLHTGQPERAQKLLEQALENQDLVFEKHLTLHAYCGLQQRERVCTILALSRLYIQQQRYKDAEVLLNKIGVINRSTKLSPEQLHEYKSQRMAVVLATRGKAGASFGGLKILDRELPVRRVALQQCRAITTDSYKQARHIAAALVASDLKAISTFHMELGDYDLAENDLRTGIDAHRSAPTNDDVLKLASILHAEHRYGESESCYLRAIKSIEAKTPTNALCLALAMQSFSFLLEDENRPAEAASYKQRAEAMFKNIPGWAAGDSIP